MYVGIVCLQWCALYSNKEGTETKASEIVLSIPRVVEAFKDGWTACNGALQSAAGLGLLETLKLCRSCGVEWGDGIFGAAVANGHDHVVEWLIGENCPKDQMGLKALKVALDLGRAEIVACWFWEEVRHEDRVEAEELATARLERALEARNVEMIGPLSRFVVRDDVWLVELCYSFAKSGDLEMLKALEEFIIHDDRLFVLLNSTLAAAEEGCFAAVSHLLCWWWRVMSEAPNPITERLIPDAIVFFAARLGDVRMVQWCREHGDRISVWFCSDCVGVEGWSAVPVYAAGAGQVDLVLWCLENGWEYADSIAESAAREGHSNVVEALRDRGHCSLAVSEGVPVQRAGLSLWEQCHLKRCGC